MKRKILALVSLLLALTAIGTGAEEGKRDPGEEDPQSLFAEAIEVNVVNVEVYVTDRDGRRVLDLKKDDFEILEDGKTIPISNFYVVQDRDRRTAVRPAPSVPGTPAVEETEEEPPPERRRLHLLVYIDNANIHPFHRNNVMRHLRVFLNSTLGEGDRVAVYTYEKELHLRQAFTTNRGEVADALLEIEELSALGTSQDRERRDLLRDIDRAGSRREIEGRLRLHAQGIANDLSFSIEALKKSVDSLAGLPGRKAVLYVSDGLPMRAGEDLYKALADRFSDPSLAAEAITYDASRSFRELTARANANGVTFYTIEAAGLRSFSGGTADSASSRSHIGVDSVAVQNRQAPLRSMAAETGGVAITGTSNFDDGLAKIGDDFAGYYSLGYVSPTQADGRYHEIEVRALGGGLRVRHRDGYRSKTAKDRMSEMTLAALTYDAGRNPLELGVEIATGIPQEGSFLVPIVLRVPLRNVTVLPFEQLYRGRLKLFIATRDDHGRMATIADQPWPIEIPANRIEEAKAMSFAHEVSLLMRPGRHTMAIGLLDEVAGVSSFVTQVVQIGPSGSG